MDVHVREEWRTRQGRERGDKSLVGEEHKGETTKLVAGVLKHEEQIQGMHQNMGAMMG